MKHWFIDEYTYLHVATLSMSIHFALICNFSMCLAFPPEFLQTLPFPFSICSNNMESVMDYAINCLDMFRLLGISMVCLLFSPLRDGSVMNISIQIAFFFFTFE